MYLNDAHQSSTVFFYIKPNSHIYSQYGFNALHARLHAFNGFIFSTVVVLGNLSLTLILHSHMRLSSHQSKLDLVSFSPLKLSCALSGKLVMCSLAL